MQQTACSERCQDCGMLFKRLASHKCPKNPKNQNVQLNKHFGPIPPPSEKLQQALKASLKLEKKEMKSDLRQNALDYLKQEIDYHFEMLENLNRALHALRTEKERE